MPEQQVFLNGSMLPIGQANVSVLDRGFLLGDGVYEVIPAYGGKLFRLPQHLRRLDDSLRAIHIDNPYNKEQWETLLQALVEQYDSSQDVSVYLQVTRGPAARRDHLYPDEVTPTVFAMCTPITAMDDEKLAKGFAAITLDDIRWQRCDIKAITLLANVLLKQQAQEAGALEAILIREGHALEGAASNLFIVKNGVISTPPKGHYMLPGITRDLVIELAKEYSIPCHEQPIPLDDLHTADEIWLTSSTKEIVPITRLDNNIVGDGLPGPLWQTMITYYRDYKADLRKSPA